MIRFIFAIMFKGKVADVAAIIIQPCDLVPAGSAEAIRNLHPIMAIDADGRIDRINQWSYQPLLKRMLHAAFAYVTYLDRKNILRYQG